MKYVYCVSSRFVLGRRLAEALHLSAKGAKLLSLMLKTELQGVNLFNASSVRFSLDILTSMPTICCIKLYGVREALKYAVRNATKFLVRHSKWLLPGELLDMVPANDIVIFCVREKEMPVSTNLDRRWPSFRSSSVSRRALV